MFVLGLGIRECQRKLWDYLFIFFFIIFYIFLNFYIYKFNVKINDFSGYLQIQNQLKICFICYAFISGESVLKNIQWVLLERVYFYTCSFTKESSLGFRQPKLGPIKLWRSSFLFLFFFLFFFKLIALWQCLSPLGQS